jgi:hypothetical protein
MTLPMGDGMAPDDDISMSRCLEMDTYVSSMSAMYSNAVQQLSEVYDIAFAHTDGFRSIDKAAILADSRIIKVLRYALAPSISQMKFGQLFGETSTEPWERTKLTSSSKRWPKFERTAGDIAAFVNAELDRSRFRWIDSAGYENPIAFEYAKNWTCGLAADQNAQTRYRNWRKDQQELAIVSRLVELGYVKSSFSGIVHSESDIAIGEYCSETKVKGRTRQKADVVFRSKTSKKLVLLEAKAVGVELDATKRTKECCDKSNDWASSPQLNQPIVVAVIAGFFTASNIENLVSSNVGVVWEHDLDSLKRFA